MADRRPRPNLSAGDRLQAVPHSVRAHVLALLDEMSAPMPPREIERALCRSGLSRSEARRMIYALKGVAIIAIGAS